MISEEQLAQAPPGLSEAQQQLLRQVANGERDDDGAWMGMVVQQMDHLMAMSKMHQEQLAQLETTLREVQRATGKMPQTTAPEGAAPPDVGEVWQQGADRTKEPIGQ